MTTKPFRCDCGGLRHKCDMVRIAQLEADKAETSAMLDKLASDWADKLDTMEDARDAALALMERAEAELARKTGEWQFTLDAYRAEYNQRARAEAELRLACRMIAEVAERGIRRWGPVCAPEMAPNPLGSDIDDKVTAEEWFHIRTEQLLDDILPADLRTRVYAERSTS